MDTFIYIGKVNLYWIMLYACYWLMLRNHTFFKWNRLYLLGSLMVAFALPFVIYPETAPVLVQYEISAEAFTLAAEETVEQPFITWTQIVWLLYGAGFLVAAMRLIRHSIELKNFLNAGEIIDLDDCKVVLIDSDKIGSFSFLKWIVINRSDYENHFDAILRHEMVHTQQLHSLDILFIEILKVVFWFNPFLLLYKRSFQEVHEFLADEQAPNREKYARFLVAYALNAPVASLTNHFFKPSQIKSRIKMIYKNRTSKWMLGTYAIALTLIGTVALVVAGCEQKEDSAITESEKDAKTVEVVEMRGDKVFSVVEEQPEFPGGTQEMYKFMATKIRYPSAAVKANISGRVFLSFIVTDDGNISEVEVLKGIGYGCDDEAVRVLKMFPKWQPGRQNGIPVNVKYNLPINFQLEDTDSKKSALKLKTDPAKEPLMIVDGKTMNAAQVEKLDPNTIKSVNVLKDKLASTTYGEKAKYGVVEIQTKGGKLAANSKPASVENQGTVVTAFRSDLGFTNADAGLAKVTIKGNANIGSLPLVILDGVTQEKRGEAAFKDINPNDIQAISVLKNQSAVSAYGEEGRDGVVVITTKK
ncbi:M56 family metallopeptidase [Dyadobacter sp. CY323]|uniref:M56 family metallopeptidase n=1 Tax=Dyadobacter sp. CY323 TaxID=2907302 RepID=UPI001F293BEF|nr:M56 family metallopeptidase [Dyadobacter sp. CY323]MCE6988692.1 M56 family metallopeptidase [Dyadobacter sp. CY323]